jgi:RluA family pseudouridine synthase
MREPTILFEDDAVVVVDKPSGMITLPDGRHDYPALTDWLAKKYKEVHLVHRIDRETSGLLIVAKTLAAQAFLKEQFGARSVHKVYRAFVYGGLKSERGTIDKPIGSARGGRGPRSALRPHGTLRDAVTQYRVLRRGGGATYIAVAPKTGRTHQIRVHMASVQHPIIHDDLYAPTRASLLGFERLALHAHTLMLTLPSGEERIFMAPLPEDFLKAEQLLLV